MNHRVRVVDTDGIITTFAGSGDAGSIKYGDQFSGDGGPATEAVMYAPTALAISDAGNVYIGEALNYCVRAVGPDGIMRTVAGGVRDENQDDNGSYNHQGFSGDGGPATEALFGLINDGLALDSSGNLYMSTGNQRIRVVEAIESFASGGDGGDGGSEDSQSDIVVLPSGEVGPIGLDLDTAFGDQGLRQTPENPGAGDKIEVEVFITEGGRGESGFLVEFAWDPTKLTFSGFSTQDVFSGAITLETPGEGSMTLSNVFLGFGAIKDSGSVGVATFEVAETFSGAATITLSSAKLGIHRPDNDLIIGPGASYVVIGGNEEVSLTPQQASDFDGDGTVGFGDFLQFASGFGAVIGDSNFNSIWDLDKDGSVGFGDFLAFASVFGQKA